jgi:photosystem II stability/assembly factor-like uncharacterized protein
MRYPVRSTLLALLCSGLWLTASAQSVWTQRNPVTQQNNLNFVAWLGSQFVAVGASGTLVTSSNGTTWTVRTSGAGTNALYSVATDGSKLVAVGAAGTIVTSTNGGANWSAATSGVTGNLFGVAWSGTQFVAVGAAGTVLSSPDGATWTARAASLTTQGLNSVTWSVTAGKFVAVGNSGAVLVSGDGLSWTLANSGVSLYSVTWTGAEFLAVGASGVIRASADGSTWAARTSGTTTALLGVTLGSRLVTVGSSGTIRQSTDGTTWSAGTSGTSSNLNWVAWSGSQFVAVGAGGLVLNSTDGVTWSQSSSYFSALYAITSRAVAGDTVLMASGAGGMLLTSRNGINWTKRSTGVSQNLYAVAATGTNNSFFVAVGATGTNGTLLTSSDTGATWTARTAPAASDMYAVAGNTNATPTLVAVGASGAIFASTTGGVSWVIPTPTGSSPPPLPAVTLNGIAWQTANTFVAVGNGGEIWRTTAPTGSWFTQTSPITQRLNAITYTATPTTLFVAVGDGGKIVTSTNGTAWTERTSGVVAVLRAVTWTGTQFVVTGDGGVVLTSPDGTTWTPQVSGTSTALYGVRWDGRQTVAVGAGGLILTSAPDALPLAPTPSGPVSTNTPVNPNFSWSVASGAISYRVQVSTTNTFTSPLIDTVSAGSGTSIILGPLTEGATYYWRVRTNGNTGSSDWSSTATFTVVASTSSKPVLSSPANNATNIPLSSSVAWTAYTGATAYRVQVSTDSTFATTLINENVSGTTRLLSSLVASTKYYWRVYALTPAGNTAWSTLWRFTTTAPAPVSPPALSTPADNAKNVSLTAATLTWGTVTNAATYRVQLSTTSDFSGTLLKDTAVAGTTLAIPGLTTNGVYYWHVNAQNAAGASAYSATRTFTTAIDLAPPSLTSPAQNAQNVDPFGSLTWNTLNGAVTYHVQLSTNNFTAIVFEDSTLTAGTYTHTLSGTTTYQWRVRAKNPAGPSSWSTTRTFTTAAVPTQPPAAPALSTPASFTTVTSLTPTLVWRKAATARGYRVQVSATTDFSTVLFTDSIPDTSRAVPTNTLTSGGTYYWRVNASNNVGTGAWSETFAFFTPAVAPAAPTLTSPAQFADSVSTTPTLTWTASTGATAYRVQVSTSQNFTSTVVNDSITATSLAVQLNPVTQYFWRVYARNSVGASAWSTTFRFTTAQLPLPGVPTPQTPAQFATDIPVTGSSLAWLASSNATTYHVQISTVPTFANTIQNDSGLTALTRAVAGTLAGKTDYYWRVRAKNSAGVSAWSSTQRFTTVVVVPILPGTISLRSSVAGGNGILRFALPKAERVVVRVYDTRGALVAELANAPMEAGYHVITLPPSMRGGVHLVEFRAGNYRSLIKTQP